MSEFLYETIWLLGLVYLFYRWGHAAGSEETSRRLRPDLWEDRG